MAITHGDIVALAAALGGGGGSGTTDYEKLHNLPQINGVELKGDKSSDDLKIPKHQNAYETIKPVGDPSNTYLFETTYNDIRYDEAFTYFDNEDTGFVGACSFASKGNTVGRNYDWLYDNKAEFIVKVGATANRYASVGIAGQMSELTLDFVNSREYSEQYKYLPFKMMDGINEHGLFVSIHTVPNDKGDTTGTSTWEPDPAKVQRMNALMLIRYLLDNFKTIDDLKGAICGNISVYVPQAMRDLGFEVHFVLKDASNKVEVLEFIDNECVFTDITNRPVVTNFFIDGVTFKSDGKVPEIGDADIESYGLTEHAQGLERYNLLIDGISEEWSDLDAIMTSVYYTNLYTKTFNEGWVSEYCGTGDLKISTPRANFETAYNEGVSAYATRSRDTAKTYQTCHQSCYEWGDDLKIWMHTQEDGDEWISVEPKFVKIPKTAAPLVIQANGTVEREGENIPDLDYNQVIEIYNAYQNDNQTVYVKDQSWNEQYTITGTRSDSSDIVIYLLFRKKFVIAYRAKSDDGSVSIEVNVLEESVEDIGSYQFVYEGFVLPAIEVEALVHIYHNHTNRIPQVILWTFMGSETYLKVISADYLSGEYSIDVLVHNKYHCQYTWTSAVSGIVNPDVRTGDIATFIFKGYITSTAPTTNLHVGDLWYNSSSEDMPTTFPISVKKWEGTGWSSSTENYTPANLEMWANQNSGNGYYWFGNDWNLIDSNVIPDDSTLTLNSAGQMEIKNKGHDASKLKDTAIGSGLEKSTDGTQIKHKNNITAGTINHTLTANTFRFPNAVFDTEGHISSKGTDGTLTFTDGVTMGTDGNIKHSNSITSTGTNNKIWQTQLDAQGHHTGTQTGYDVSTAISSSSTDTQVASAKAVFNFINPQTISVSLSSETDFKIQNNTSCKIPLGSKTLYILSFELVTVTAQAVPTVTTGMNFPNYADLTAKVIFGDKNIKTAHKPLVASSSTGARPILGADIYGGSVSGSVLQNCSFRIFMPNGASLGTYPTTVYLFGAWVQ